MPRNTRWLFYLSLAVLTFVVGAWLVRTPEPARPLPWLADWQEQVLAPLADNALTLRQLHDAVDGELWVDPRLDGVRLAFRGRLLGDGGPWQVEGELGLSAEEQLEPAAGICVAAWQRAAAIERRIGRTVGRQADRGAEHDSRRQGRCRAAAGQSRPAAPAPATGPGRGLGLSATGPDRAPAGRRLATDARGAAPGPGKTAALSFQRSRRSR